VGNTTQVFTGLARTPGLECNVHVFLPWSLFLHHGGKVANDAVSGQS
jgi:hypothetical protein